MSGFARRYPFIGSKNVASTNVWRISALILKSGCFALDYPIIRSIKLPLNSHVSRIIRNFNVRPQFFPAIFQSSVKSEYRILSPFPSSVEMKHRWVYSNGRAQSINFTYSTVTISYKGKKRGEKKRMEKRRAKEKRLKHFFPYDYSYKLS